MDTNLKCVYRHRRADNNEVFYVGIGNYERPYIFKDRSAFWKKVKNKSGGVIVEILAENLSWEDACDLEKLLISEYGRKDNNTGILVNHTDGGEGTLNVIVSSETRKKLSNHSKNLERTKEWYNKVSEALTGRKLSESHIQKLSNAKKGVKGNNTKKVIDTSTGKVYNSLKEVSDYSKLKYTTLQSMLSGKNKNKTFFKYLKDAD